MVKDYNKEVSKLFGVRKRAGEVGLEIEMEGRGLHRGPIEPYWEYHQDGSLRGEENAEYVLRIPVKRDLVPEALSLLFKFLKDNGSVIRQDSPNTSVHVHLNMQDVSLKKTYTVACLWYILESLLMEWCGAERSGNLFCLRAGDAELQLQRLSSAVRYNRYADLNDQDGLRYAAMNYTALGKFGSLEFRGLAGVYDQKVIETWVRILLAVKDFGLSFDNPTELIQEFSRSGPEEFLKLVLPNNLWREVATPDMNKTLREGMRLIQNVAYCVNWEKDQDQGEKKKEPLDDASVLHPDDIPLEGGPDHGDPAVGEDEEEERDEDGEPIETPFQALERRQRRRVERGLELEPQPPQAPPRIRVDLPENFRFEDLPAEAPPEQPPMPNPVDEGPIHEVLDRQMERMRRRQELEIERQQVLNGDIPAEHQVLGRAQRGEPRHGERAVNGLGNMIQFNAFENRWVER